MSIKRILIIATTALFAVGGLTGTVFGATNFSSRAEALSQISDQSVESITAQRQQGKTLGMIASEAGALAAFQSQNLEAKKLF